MGVQVLFLFGNGPRGVVMLDYDHFKHGTKGTWSTMCPLVGTSNEGTPEVAGGPVAAGGTMEIVGSVCSLYQTANGKNTLAAKLQGYPQLGGVSAEEIKSRNFHGTFRIYKAKINDGNSTGNWQITGQGNHCKEYDYSLTETETPVPGSQAAASSQPTPSLQR